MGELRVGKRTSRFVRWVVDLSKVGVLCDGKGGFNMVVVRGAILPFKRVDIPGLVCTRIA